MSETRCPNKVHGPDYVLWMEEDESDSKENVEDVTDNVYSWGGLGRIWISVKHIQNKKVGSELKTNKCWPFSLFGRWKKCVWVGCFQVSRHEM